MTQNKFLALSLGDPDGIGPEIALKAWDKLRDASPRFAVYADINLLTPSAEALGLPPPRVVSNIIDAAESFSSALPVFSLESARTSAQAAIASIQAATHAALKGEVLGVVTCPVSKTRLYQHGFDFPGHTEFLDHLTSKADYHAARGPVMMLQGGGLRTVLVTIHVPLKDALSEITTDKIIQTAQITAQSLKCDFAISKPRLAIAGINPHAGEGGRLGTEDRDIVQPAITRLNAEGIEVFGPLPADTLFHEEARQTYDAAICMYHDQGLIPVKTLDFHGGVNITLGLPIIRTSPDHGTAFDIAGQGVARADSLISALKTAYDLAINRQAYLA